MRALSIHRPWAWCIVECPAASGPGPKRVENRGWPPPSTILGAEPIALHAAKNFDHGAPPFARRLGVEIPHLLALAPREPGGVPRPVHPEGVIVGVARVTGWVNGAPGQVQSFAGMSRTRAESVVASPWFFGPYGWVLEDVVALPQPVPHRGAQGVWVVQAAGAREVLAEVAKARAFARGDYLDRLAGELVAGGETA